MNTTEINNKLLEHAVLNQLQADFGDADFDAYSEMFNLLIGTFPEAKNILFEYLSDTAQKNLEEGETFKRY